MAVGKKTIRIFKIANRKGFAALCGGCLTEGKTKQEAHARMVKAVRRVEKKKKK